MPADDGIEWTPGAPTESGRYACDVVSHFWMDGLARRVIRVEVARHAPIPDARDARRAAARECAAIVEAWTDVEHGAHAALAGIVARFGLDGSEPQQSTAVAILERMEAAERARADGADAERHRIRAGALHDALLMLRRRAGVDGGEVARLRADADTFRAALAGHPDVDTGASPEVLARQVVNVLGAYWRNCKAATECVADLEAEAARLRGEVERLTAAARRAVEANAVTGGGERWCRECGADPDESEHRPDCFVGGLVAALDAPTGGGNGD